MMKRIKTREFVRRTLTDLLSMSPWPLEAAGTFVLWHYGRLFSSTLALAHDYRSICAEIMPHDGWGLFARALAYALAATCFVTWFAGVRFYRLRVVLALMGLICWGVLVYSCASSGVPVQIFELYAFFLAVQAYVELLLQTRRRAEGDD